MNASDLEIVVNKVIESFKSKFDIDPDKAVEYVAFSINEFMENFNKLAEGIKENNE